MTKPYQITYQPKEQSELAASHTESINSLTDRIGELLKWSNMVETRIVNGFAAAVITVMFKDRDPDEMDESEKQLMAWCEKVNHYTNSHEDEHS